MFVPNIVYQLIKDWSLNFYTLKGNSVYRFERIPIESHLFLNHREIMKLHKYFGKLNGGGVVYNAGL